MIVVRVLEVLMAEIPEILLLAVTTPINVIATLYHGVFEHDWGIEYWRGLWNKISNTIRDDIDYIRG